MAEWKKFWNERTQVEEMIKAPHGFLLRYVNGTESDIFHEVYPFFSSANISEYLICEPHPHGARIERWIRTGQPVYKYDKYYRNWQMEATPMWLPGEEYAFNPPKEPRHIEVRDYLYKTINGGYAKGTANKELDDCARIEASKQFVKWLDDEWWLIEI